MRTVSQGCGIWRLYFDVDTCHQAKFLKVLSRSLVLQFLKDLRNSDECFGQSPEWGEHEQRSSIEHEVSAGNIVC